MYKVGREIVFVHAEVDSLLLPVVHTAGRSQCKLLWVVHATRTDWHTKRDWQKETSSCEGLFSLFGPVISLFSAWYPFGAPRSAQSESAWNTGGGGINAVQTASCLTLYLLWFSVADITRK